MGIKPTCCIALAATTAVVGMLFYWFMITSHKNGRGYNVARSTHCLEYSPAFPSAGGGGCSPKCNSDDNKSNSTYRAIYYHSTNKWPTKLVHNMHHAAEILKTYGPLHSLDTERECYVHVALDYFCCYSPEEAVKIGEFINSYKWKPQEVQFDRVVCAIHAPGDMVSLVLMLDKNSQTKLLEYTLESEAEFERTTGIKKHIPHTKLQGFHMTLATVNQSLFPVRPAVDEINKTILPGTWYSEAVTLHKPECKKCEKVKKDIEGTANRKR